MRDVNSTCLCFWNIATDERKIDYVKIEGITLCFVFHLPLVGCQYVYRSGLWKGHARCTFITHSSRYNSHISFPSDSNNATFRSLPIVLGGTSSEWMASQWRDALIFDSQLMQHYINVVWCLLYKWYVSIILMSITFYCHNIII